MSLNIYISTGHTYAYFCDFNCIIGTEIPYNRVMTKNRANRNIRIMFQGNEINRQQLVQYFRTLPSQ